MKIKKVMKKIPKKVMTFMLLAAMIFSYIASISNVVAEVQPYGSGENFITFFLDNQLGFTVNGVTINGSGWDSQGDYEYHTTDGQYIIVIHVAKNEATGDKTPTIRWGGNWNDRISMQTVVDGNNYTFTIQLDNDNNINEETNELQTFVGFEIIQLQEQPNPGDNPGGNPGDNPGNEPGGVEPGPEPGEGYFDGRAYVVWSCGNGVCYHYFDNVPSFDDGNSTFYKDTEVTADNKDGVIFDVNAKYRGWYLADEFTNWKNLYEAATGETVNWDTLDPELILGEPNQHIGELEAAAIDAGACEKPAKNALREDWDAFEYCINLYAAQHNHEIWTHQLQPVGEPTDNNAYVSYGDRNFKVVIYNTKYRGITLGDLSGLNYYPSHWTNPFTRTDQYDISDTTKDNPALLDSILLEDKVKIKALGYNSFEIESIEALDVPKDAVKITKKDGEFELVFSSNFYDNVVFKVTGKDGKVSYMKIKRYTIDGYIRRTEKGNYIAAEFYFDRTKSYEDFTLTARIIYKDGSSKTVDMKAVYGIDDGLGNMTEDYERDEESDDPNIPSGKGLKKSFFQYKLSEEDTETVSAIYINAEYAGSTDTNYAGAFAGSGKGVSVKVEGELF